MSTAAVDVKIVQDNLAQFLETRAWPQFIVAGQAYVCAPRFCPDDCIAAHVADPELNRLCHMRRDHYWLTFCDEHGRYVATYRYVGRDQAADTSIWELSELRDG